MKGIVSVVAIFLCVATLAAGQAERNVSVVASPDAPGTVSAPRLSRCYEQLAREWNISVKDLPHIVVFHVSKRVAESAFIADTMAIRRNRSGKSGEEYYELWLVGELDLRYVLGLQNVLEHHFGLKPTDQQRAVVVARVARVEEATVNVSEGK